MPLQPQEEVREATGPAGGQGRVLGFARLLRGGRVPAAQRAERVGGGGPGRQIDDSDPGDALPVGPISRADLPCRRGEMAVFGWRLAVLAL